MCWSTSPEFKTQIIQEIHCVCKDGPRTSMTFAVISYGRRSYEIYLLGHCLQYQIQYVDVLNEVFKKTYFCPILLK